MSSFALHMTLGHPVTPLTVGIGATPARDIIEQATHHRMPNMIVHNRRPVPSAEQDWQNVATLPTQHLHAAVGIRLQSLVGRRRLAFHRSTWQFRLRPRSPSSERRMRIALRSGITMRRDTGGFSWLKISSQSPGVFR